jgi:hypothetical protein
VQVADQNERAPQLGRDGPLRFGEEIGKLHRQKSSSVDSRSGDAREQLLSDEEPLVRPTGPGWEKTVQPLKA